MNITERLHRHMTGEDPPPDTYHALDIPKWLLAALVVAAGIAAMYFAAWLIGGAA